MTRGEKRPIAFPSRYAPRIPSIAQLVDRVVDCDLDGLAPLGTDRVGDFHAPGRPKFGNRQKDGPAGTVDRRAGDPGRSLVVVVATVIDGSFQRPGPGRVP